MQAASSSIDQAYYNQQRIFDLMGYSLYVQHVSRQIQRVAPTSFTVIVQGDTGTGKELVARFIHTHSGRADKPFVAVDCGALPENLVESELFGYVRGAFTGADGNKEGYFEAAKGGTLFLDEISNLAPTAQMKLLRSLQESAILPVGSAKNVPTNVRIIAASNVALEDAVKAGSFRHDLFHRLDEFKIYLLPLSEHKEDILCLAERFRLEANAELHRQVRGFTAEAQAHLLSYGWPGNVRELRNVVRRAVLLSEEVIEVKHLRLGAPAPEPSTPEHTPPQEHKVRTGPGLQDIVRETVGKLEKALIQQALQEAGGNKTQAAHRLKIGYKTLFRKLKEYGIE